LLQRGAPFGGDELGFVPLQDVLGWSSTRKRCATSTRRAHFIVDVGACLAIALAFLGGMVVMVRMSPAYDSAEAGRWCAEGVLILVAAPDPAEQLLPRELHLFEDRVMSSSWRGPPSTRGGVRTSSTRRWRRAVRALLRVGLGAKLGGDEDDRARARMKNGRLLVDEPTDLPDGTELMLVTAAQERPSGRVGEPVLPMLDRWKTEDVGDEPDWEISDRKIDDSTKTVRSEIADLRDVVAQNSNDIRDLRGEVTQMRHDFGRLRREVEEARH
jgi:hypothetical protein